MQKVLKVGMKGKIVEVWQNFLRGIGKEVNSSGVFDELTETSTKEFQKDHSLKVDGIVGDETLKQAASLGFILASLEESDVDFPASPSLEPITGQANRQRIFGPIQFVPSPVKGNPEKITITNHWEKESLIWVTVPELVGIPGGGNGKIQFHKKAAEQFVALWKAWREAGLLSHIKTFDGAWVARFIRGKAAEQILSNHAFGTAFDINCKWNPFGGKPAPSGQAGCVYALIPLANKFGFYWGGHFKNKKDGMHFEVAQIRS